MAESIELLMDVEDLAIVGPPENVTVAFDIGSTGKRGSLWFTGEGLPSPLTIPNYDELDIGDMYMDSSDGGIYQMILLPSNTTDWVKTDVSAAGPTGPKGDKGDKGETGPANTLEIGTVTTGAPGSAAAVSITGTAPNQTLNLTLPKGETGPAGTPSSIVDAKGDLLVGSANDTIVRKAVGPNGALLMADSNDASGLSYQSPIPLLVNLLANSDFSGGTTGWTTSEGTLTLNSGKLRFVSAVNGVYASFRITPDILYTAGRKYYFSAETTLETTKDLVAPNLYIGVNASQAILAFPNVTGPARSSAVFTALSTTSSTIIFSRLSQGKYMDLDNVMLIDLTACFGAGKEPTLAEMDAIMARYPNSWFAKETPQLLPTYDWLKLTQGAATNLVTNGDFSNGTTGWGASGSSVTATGGTATFTGDGSYSFAYIVKSSGLKRQGQKVYVRATMRATSGSPTFLSVSGGGVAEYNLASPTLNQWYTISGLVTVPTTGIDLGLTILTGYADTTAANGSTTEVKNALLIDLTTTFGAGNEPTKSEIDYLLTKYPNSWFNGTVNDLVTRYDSRRRIGTGSPEGVVTAPVGTEWTDIAATNGAIKWIKSTGTGNTGWTVSVGDTGWRKTVAWTNGVITAGSMNNIVPLAGSTGGIFFRRIQNVVHFSIVCAEIVSSSHSFDIPAGFSAGAVPYPKLPVVMTVSGAEVVRILNAGLITGSFGAGAGTVLASASGSYGATASWATLQAWPTTLPGTAA